MPRSSLCGFTECSACQKNKSLGGLFSSNCIHWGGDGHSKRFLTFSLYHTVQQLPHQVIALYYKWNKNFMQPYLRLGFFPSSSSLGSVVFSAPFSFCSFLLMSSLIFSLLSESYSSSASVSSSTSPSASSSVWKNTLTFTIREKQLRSKRDGIYHLNSMSDVPQLYLLMPSSPFSF